jgi:hypothetical protein
MWRSEFHLRRGCPFLDGAKKAQPCIFKYDPENGARLMVVENEKSDSRSEIDKYYLKKYTIQQEIEPTDVVSWQNILAEDDLSLDVHTLGGIDSDKHKKKDKPKGLSFFCYEGHKRRSYCICYINRPRKAILWIAMGLP